MGVRFGILGPVEVLVEGQPVTGLAPRHRAVFAYLLLHAGTVLSAERLIDAVWGLTPPDTARSQIHAAVTAIRRVLREAGAPGVLATRPAGYVLDPAPGRLDLREFTSLVAAGEVRAALALWRGEPFADITADYVADARNRLVERRLAAFERLVAAELAAGRHAELIDEIAAELATAPLRERLVCDLMLALYRSGRQADALRTGRNYRTALVEEQGLDPGMAFVELEQAILRGEPSLAADAEPAPPPASYLPYDIPDFAGRDAEVKRLAEALPAIVTIDGMAGIGKTSFAIHAAYQLAGQFPGGQLFVDLRAHTAGAPPLESGAALEILLRQLGLPADRVPASAAERSALWRAELTGRRALVVLDNAAGIDQLRPLLPGGSGSLVLITSRIRLTDVDGAYALSLDLLPAADSVDLFTTIVGERAHAEPLAVLDVLQLCGFLPLAVRIAAARVQHRPQWTVGYLADRLRHQRKRLAELSTSERGVAAAFTLSYEHLTVNQQRMFRLLGLQPGIDIDATAAAALADLPVDRAEALLEGLLDTHMLVQHEPGRYTFHDLLREHARATVAVEETEEGREAALTRLLDHYLHTAIHAIDLVNPYSGFIRRGVGAAPAAEHLTSTADARAWLEAERANLVAAGCHGGPTHTGRLSTTLSYYLYNRGYLDDMLALNARALQVSRDQGDLAGRAAALLETAWVHFLEGDHDLAQQQAQEALVPFRSAGDRVGEARSRNIIGMAALRQGDADHAYEQHQWSFEVYRELGDGWGEAATRVNLGNVAERQGDQEEAIKQYRTALDLYRECDNPHGQASTLNQLGTLYQRRGDRDAARDSHQQALDLVRDLGFLREQSIALNGLGEVADPKQAVEYHTEALELTAKTRNRPEEARAHHGLVRAQHALGAPEAEELKACHSVRPEPSPRRS